MSQDIIVEINKRKHFNKENVVLAKFTDITNDYIFQQKPLGSGGYGTVYRALHIESGYQRAIKLIKTPVNLKTVSSDGMGFKNFFL
jgi:hypothetical protein